MKKAALLLFLVPVVFSCRSVHTHDENREKKHILNEGKNPEFLVGRLPGEKWQEHYPARFGALQSFETFSTVNKAVLALHRNDSPLSAAEFLTAMTAKSRGSEVAVEESLKTAEGEWNCLLIRSDRGLSRLYALKKHGRVYWVHYSSPDTESFALHAADVRRYLSEFWFLYKE